MNITSNLLQLSCTHGAENVNKIYQYLLIITQGNNTRIHKVKYILYQNNLHCLILDV